MYDVARLAGVSHQTVSRVINGSDHVKPETRDRVLAAMEKLDYRPNSVARALVTGRSRTLGVVTFDTTLYGPASTLVGIERAAHAAGYFVSIVSLEALDRMAVMRAIERLRALGVDGVLLIAPQIGPMGALWDMPADLPVVAVDVDVGLHLAGPFAGGCGEVEAALSGDESDDHAERLDLALSQRRVVAVAEQLVGDGAEEVVEDLQGEGVAVRGEGAACGEVARGRVGQLHVR